MSAALPPGGDGGGSQPSPPIQFTGGLGIDNITGGSGDDTFTFIAGMGLTSADTVNGGTGIDTVALTGGLTITTSDFDKVSNIEVITLANTSTNVAITTKNTLVTAGATLTLNASSLTTGALTFNGSAEADGAFNITGGSRATGDTITGGSKDDTIAGGAGTDTITGSAGADTITLGGSADDDTRQKVIYSEVTDGAAAGANSGADFVTQFDADGVGTDDLTQITGTLRTLLNDDADTILDYSATPSNPENVFDEDIANQEATVLLDAEVELMLSDFTTLGLDNVLTELGEEINFTGIVTGQEHLFIINFSATQAALLLYTAGAGGDDSIVAADIQVLGIVTHNDGIGLVADDITF